ncbi:hypothetical protein RJ640_028195 [Escallonia rubra]|uniref:Clp ATPase C-terminal domain-containing protein n=1 Tax=Escallonia rubra TaxID=112253 RepID=A0AA88QI12_9ASTE|nr:hypothetical protein RJ640_028195 [Escallonia rubra]
MEELTQYFKPEFLNRLDDTIVFRQLTELQVKEIADIMLSEVFKRLKSRDIKLQLTKRFKDKVAKEGYDPKYGATPLRRGRAFMKLLEDRLAKRILMGDIRNAKIGWNGTSIRWDRTRTQDLRSTTQTSSDSPARKTCEAQTQATSDSPDIPRESSSGTV